MMGGFRCCNDKVINIPLEILDGQNESGGAGVGRIIPLNRSDNVHVGLDFFLDRFDHPFAGIMRKGDDNLSDFDHEQRAVLDPCLRLRD